MKRQGASAIILLLLVTLIACGSTPPTVGNQVATNPTATPPAASAPAATPTTAPAIAPSAAPIAPIPTTATTPPTPVPTRPTAPSASAPPASAPPASSPPPASPAAATPAATTPSAVSPQPNGPIPAGWKVYTGPRAFPIVIAYPPDWRVDTSLYPEQLIIFLVGPNDGQDQEQRVDIEPNPQPIGANIDVQRDEYFHRKTEFCERKGIESTDRRQVSGAAFALLGATCDQSNTLYLLQVASGVTGGDEWNISLRSLYDRKAEHQAIFDQMLASINIYGLLPR